MKKITFIFTALIFVLCGCVKEAEKVSIIPKPQFLESGIGYFKIDNDVKVCYSPSDSLEKLASMYCMMINSKIETQVAPFESSTPKEKGGINLIIDPSLDTLGVEGYNLEVTPKVVSIKAAHPQALFMALQSLDQLIDDNGLIPVVKISDKPQFEWRGAMLDIARHFYDKEFIFNFIDILSYHKMNKLHLHLCDGIGWRMEIDSYPELHNRGAFRKVTPNSTSWENFSLYDGSSDRNSGEWYGGYLTKDDLREIVKYAADRYIEVIPEIEMPGHSEAALHCYPQYSCPNTEGKAGVYCAGNDETFKFLADILDEVAEIFPSEYIHVGGDEVGKGQWLNCPLCKTRMRQEGLKDGEELQSYFIKRMERHIASLGKRLIGWNEILEGGLPSSATVMSWTGFDGGIEAANMGHDVVMAPMSHCYFDHYQGDNNFEPQGWGGYNSVERVYNFYPVPDNISPEKRHHILGGQTNLWTETVPDSAHVEYMMMPRLSALSEALWSDNRAKDWEEFKVRLDRQFDNYKKRGYNYAESALTPLVNIDNSSKDSVVVELYTELGGYPIYYTLDGSEPTENSTQYINPIAIKECATLRAVTYRGGEKVGYSPVYEMLKSKAYGAEVTFEHPYSKSYSGGDANALTDNISAIKRGDSPYWQGVERENFIVTLDLGSEQVISKVLLSYFQHLSTTSVVLPTQIDVYTSLYGEKFDLLESIKDVKDIRRDGIIVKYRVDSEPITCRYVKVVSKSIGVLPEGYNRAGSSGWVFMDEICVE